MSDLLSVVGSASLYLSVLCQNPEDNCIYLLICLIRLVLLVTGSGENQNICDLFHGYLFSFSVSPKPKTEAMVRSPPVMSPSTATQMDSKIPNQGKPGSTGSQSQLSPCDPKTLGAKGAQNVPGGMGLKNGQGLTSGPSSKVKVKRERSTSVESFDQPESGTSTTEDKGRHHTLAIGSRGHT